MTQIRMKCGCGAELERDDGQYSGVDSPCAGAIAAFKWDHRMCRLSAGTSLEMRIGRRIGLTRAIEILEAGFCGEETDYGKGWDAAIRNRIEELRKVAT